MPHHHLKYYDETPSWPASAADADEDLVVGNNEDFGYYGDINTLLNDRRDSMGESLEYLSGESIGPLDLGFNDDISTKEPDMTLANYVYDEPEYWEPELVSEDDETQSLPDLAEHPELLELPELPEISEIPEIPEVLELPARPKIHKSGHKRVRLAVRQRSTKTSPAKRRHKLGRPVDPKAKVELTEVPDLRALHSLLGVESKGDGRFHLVHQGSLSYHKARRELELDDSREWKFKSNQHERGAFPGRSQMVVLVNEKYRVSSAEESAGSRADWNKFPGAVGFERQKGSRRTVVPIYDNFEVATEEIFGLSECSLVRVTRAGTQSRKQAVVLKLETAHPGDTQLNDIDESVDGRCADQADEETLGAHGDPVTSLFIKKKIARPRYKGSKRVYLLPRNTNVILYTEERMLERDLEIGVLDLETERRVVFASFDHRPLFRRLGIRTT